MFTCKAVVSIMYFTFHIQSIYFYFQKLEAPPFTFRAVIGIAIGAGSLAGGILLFCVIWRLWRPSKDKEEKFGQQPNNINSKKNTTEFIPPKTNRKVTANYIE